MKKSLLILVACIFSGTIYAQSLSVVCMDRSGDKILLCFRTIDNALINVSKEGQLVGYGMENLQRQNLHWMFPPQLDPYMGRVENYSDNEDVNFRGKVKYIGQTMITYYATYDKDELHGKIKCIGATDFVYFESYSDKSFAGNIQRAGNNNFNYYSSFDNEALKGKFKTIGNTGLSYYSSFEDKAIKGRIKNIGTDNFTYYTSFDRKGYQGAQKSGFQTKFINSIRFQVFP